MHFVSSHRELFLSPYYSFLTAACTLREFILSPPLLIQVMLAVYQGRDNKVENFKVDTVVGH